MTTADRYDPEARLALLGAEAIARDLGHLTVEPLHVLRELLERCDLLWKELRADRRDIAPFVDVRLARQPRNRSLTPSPSTTLSAMVDRAATEASPGPVRPVHLLLATAQLAEDEASEILRDFDITPAQVRATSAFRGGPSSSEPARPTTDGGRPFEPWAPSRGPASPAEPGQPSTRPAPPRPEPRVETGEEQDPLLRFGTDLTALAAAGSFDPIIGRSQELRRVMQILGRRLKNNPVLVGEPGVGKRAIVQALALRIVSGDVPEPLRGRRIVSLETGALVAGARIRGELEQRVKWVVDALRESGGRTLLFAEELPSLVAAGASPGAVGAGDLLKPALARGEVRIIGRTTAQQYRTHLEKDPTLTRCFQPVPVDPPTDKEAVAILRGVVERYEAHHGVRISDPACVAAVRLSQRYLPDRHLPDKAIDLVDESAARLRLEIDSVPADLDDVERRLEALEIEHRSLHDDHDRASLAHRDDIEREIAELTPRAKALRDEWLVQKEALHRLKEAKASLQDARRDERARRAAGELGKASELRFDLIPRLEKDCEDHERRLAEQGSALVRAAVSEADIARTIADWTGIPVSKMLEAEAERLLRMEERLRERVVGQDEAVTLVSKAVRRGRVGLRDPGRPIGSFLFLGPTGVGKTELAKALAEFLFDDENAMARLDMSEFMERHMVARLVGAPPGYVDSEEGGYLTEAVRARPYSVVLLDEVEKAHRDVFDILLQVLDDGRLTDGRGRTVDFTNTVIVMTSNIGGARILEHEGDQDSLREVVNEELRGHLRPEFLNRIDDIVVFGRLSKEALRGIGRIQMRRLEAILAERGIGIELDETALDLLVELGYEPAFGARPLRRVILKRIQDPLAEQLLRGGYAEGDRVRVAVEGSSFTFAKASQR